MPEGTPISLVKPLNRLASATVESPRDLRDARLMPFGVVEAVAEREAYAGGPGTPKPWYYHNETWLPGLYSAVRFGGRLYGCLNLDGTPELRMYNEDYDSGDSDTYEYLPPALSDGVPTVSFVGTGEESTVPGISDGNVVEYLGVPFSKTGEAGAIFVWGFRSSPAVQDYQVPTFSAEMTEQTAYVDLYRTRELVTSGTFDFPFTDQDFSLYRVGRIPVNAHPTVANRGLFQYTDDNVWLQPTEIPDGDADFVGTVYEQPANVWFHSVLGPDRAFGARTAFMHAGVAHWGNVRYYTKEPHIALDLSGGAYEVALQFEYDTPAGPVYGPLRYPDSTTPNLMTVRADGAESACIIYVKHTDGTFYQFTRKSADDTNRYTKGSTTIYAYTSANYASAGKQTDTTPRAVTEMISEPQRVLVSAQDRPREVLYNGFDTPDGEDVRCLIGARQAEEDPIKAYDFYCFTDRHAYVVHRDGEAHFIDTLLEDVGIACVETSGKIAPLAAATPEGVVFVGTNGRVYYVTGRRAQTIDDAVRDLLTDVIDVTYDSVEDEVLIAVDDVGVYAYSLKMEGVVAMWSETTVENVGTMPDSEAPFIVVGANNYKLPRQGAGAAIRETAHVDWQPILSTKKIAIPEIRVDYDPLRYSGAYTGTEGESTVTLDSGDEFVDPSDIGALVWLEDGGQQPDGATCDLISTIAAIATGTEATISNIFRLPAPDVAGVPFSANIAWARLASMTVSNDNDFDLPAVGWWRPASPQTFKIPPGRPRYPRVKGRALLVSMTGFYRLRSLAILAEQHQSAT